MKKIVFFYKNKSEIPDILRDYFLMAPDMVDENTEIYYINYWNDEIINVLTNSGVKYINVEDGDLSILEDATFVCPLNYTLVLLSMIKNLKSAKIAALNWQEESVSLFVNQLTVLGINDKTFFKEICDKHGIISRDTDKALNLKGYSQKYDESPEMTTIPFEGLFIDNQDYVYKHNKDVLSVAWYGDVNNKELFALRNILNNLMDTDSVEKIDFHIIGEGNSKFRLDIKKFSPKIRFIYTSAMEGDSLKDYLHNMDMVFAYEKNIINCAKYSIPVIIPPVSKEEFYTDKYILTEDLPKGCLSISYKNIKAIKCKTYSINELMEKMFNGSTRENIIKNEKSYINANFNKEIIVEKFKEEISKTQISVADLLEIDNINRTIDKAAKYDKDNFMNYFNHMQEKYNIAVAGTKAKISYNAKKAISACIVPAKAVKYKFDHVKAIKWYNSVQASYSAKIENIKKIYEKNGKLKVAFLLIFDSVFPGEPVFERMLEDSTFDPYIIVMPDVDKQREREYLIKTYEKTLKTMKERYGERVIEGYNSKEDEYYNLGEKYQIVFFANPYKHLAHPYHEVEYFLNKNVLPLYICYGYAAVKYARGLLDLDFYNLVWKVFLESEANYEDYKKYQPVKGKNAYVSGYIKMDKLAEVPVKKKDRKKILICPHHTVMGWDKLNISNFLQYSELFVKLPKLYPQIDFVFRPHPLLFSNLIEKSIWSKERLDNYMERLLENENMVYDNAGDYYETFAESDGMIHDCGSFIGEYLYTEKPCCYMLKSPEELKTLFLPIGEMCMDNYYKAYTEEDIIKFIDEVIIKENDTLKEQREEFCKNTLKINYPNATNQVIKCIKDAIL